MKKILTILSICFGMTLVGAEVTHADQNLREQAIQTVYKMQSGPANCSAVSVDIPTGNLDVNILLTAAHCITPGKPSGYLMTSGNAPIAEYKVIRVSTNTDLAAIAVVGQDFHPKKAKVATELFAGEGDEVYAVGYTYGLSRMTTLGLLGETITTMTPLGNLETFTVASPNLDVGNSGGGLFQKNGDTYELIGIASMKGPSVFTNFFVTLDNIKKFIKS